MPISIILDLPENDKKPAPFSGRVFCHHAKTRAPAAHHQYTTKGEATPHQLRHAYATMLHEAGMDAKDAQYILGHSSITVTEDIYTHITKDRQIENLFRIDGYLNKIG